MRKPYARREFLKRSAMGAAGLLPAGCITTAAGFAKNDTIQLGCIGTGGRCRQLMEKLKLIPGVNVVGVCDVWDANIEKGLQLADPRAVSTRYYEQLLDNNDIDAVVVGTSDHWHTPIAIDACRAGKDVYVEKPLTHDIAEGDAIIKAQRDTSRVVQVGMQQRSMPHLIEARDLVASQEMGTVCKVHLTWNRNMERSPKNVPNIDPATVDWKRFLGSAPDQPFDPYRYRNWRWFWEFGGGIFTDLMVHFIDVAHWYLGLDHPVSATSIGSYFSKRDEWETPDTVQTLMKYEGVELQVYFEGTFANARNAAMLEFMGTGATLYCDRGRYEFHPEPRSQATYRENILGQGPRGQDFYNVPDGEVLHLSNWLDCIRARSVPNAPVEAGVSAAAAAHLANRALRSGQEAYWNDLQQATGIAE